MSSMGDSGGRRRRSAVVGGVALLSCLLVAGCTSAPDPVTVSPSAPASSGPASSGHAGSTAPSGSGAPSSSTPGDPTPSASDLAIDITIDGGKVTPSGQKIATKVGQQVTLYVTSDQDDEIHAHTGGDGYELEVPAGKPTRGSFTLTSAGSFEVESHDLEKIIVILNAS